METDKIGKQFEIRNLNDSRSVQLNTGNPSRLDTQTSHHLYESDK